MNACQKILSFILFTFSLSAFALEAPAGLSNLMGLSSKAMALGKLASSKLETPELKEYNQQMLNDHQGSMGKILAVAEKLNLPVNQAEEDHELDEMKALKGKEFEKQYVKEEVKLHERMLTLLKDKVIPATSSPLLKGMLQNYAPKLSGLLESARQLSPLISSTGNMFKNQIAFATKTTILEDPEPRVPKRVNADGEEREEIQLNGQTIPDSWKDEHIKQNQEETDPLFYDSTTSPAEIE